MSAKRLTPLQQEFLKALFGTCHGNLQKAAEEAGIDDFSLIMTDELADAIRAKAEHQLALNVPQAIFTLQNILSNPDPTMHFAPIDKLTKVCTEILDRAGLGKVERSTSSGGLKIGLIILPDKQKIQDAEFTEVKQVSENTTLPLFETTNGMETQTQTTGT